MSDDTSLNDETIPNLELFSLEDVVEITYECFIWKIPETGYNAGLISFRGLYPPGSRGSKHARFIHWKIETFCFMSRIRALIVDLRELDYVWGDDLNVRAPTRYNIQIQRIVIPDEASKPEQYKGYTGILNVNSDVIVTDIKTAFREMRLFYQN